MRDCVLGDLGSEKRVGASIDQLADPVEQSLADTPDKDIYFSRLDAAIRALAPAAQAGICVSERAHELLAVLLDAHRRALLSYDQDMDHRGTHALIAARALLTIAADGDDSAHPRAHRRLRRQLHTAEHLPSRFVGRRRGVAWSCRDRSPSLAVSCRTRDPAARDGSHRRLRDRHYGDYALASLLPNAAGEVAYLYRELDRGADRLVAATVMASHGRAVASPCPGERHLRG